MLRTTWRVSVAAAIDGYFSVMPGPISALAVMAVLAANRGTVPATTAGRSSIDPKGVATQVTLMAATRARQLGVKSSKAECPKPFVAKAATIVYQCTVPFEGVQVPYLVRFDPSGTPIIEPMAAVHTSRSLAAQVSATLSGAQQGAKVDCGSAKLLVRAVGSTVECRVVLGTGRKTSTSTVPVKLVDSSGRVEIAPSR